MIGQATAHRRANAFAQALEDAALAGEHSGEHGGGQGPGGPGGESGDGRPAAGAAHGGHGGGHGASGGHPPHGARAAHAADRRADPEQAALLTLAAALAARPRPVMAAETKTVQRAQLIAAMEQAVADGSFAAARVPEQRAERAGNRTDQRTDVRGRTRGRAAGLRKLTPRTKLSRRLAVGGLTMGVAAGAFGGVAAASTAALPGDTLYGLKRGMEDLKLDMASGDASRGKVYLDMASTRMQEARRLMDRGRGGPLDDESVGEVRKALSGMHQEAAEGHRLLSQAYKDDGSLQPMELLNTFTESHRQGWSDLRGKLPSQLAGVSDQVSSVFAAIDQEVAPLQKLLPKPHDDRSPAARTDGTGTGTGGSTGTDAPSPAGPTSAGGETATSAGGAPTPSPSGTTPDGLIGGSGLLNPPTQPPATSGSPSPTATEPHSVVLPPLLPGLLPGLGLGGEDTANE